MDKITAIRKAIHFKSSDHVPVWSGAPDTDIVSVCSGRMPIAGMTGGPIETEDGRLLQVIGADGVAVTPEEARAGAPDDWNCIWRSLDDTRGQVVIHPGVDWGDLDKLPAPDPRRKGLYDAAAPPCSSKPASWSAAKATSQRS